MYIYLLGGVLPGCFKLVRDNRSYHIWVKKPLDMAFAIFLMLLLSPLMLTVILLSYISDDHPIFFLQKRATQNGATFTIYKFCTMVKDQQGQMQFTKLGKWLRSTSLDELPQLFNVIKGEMSLVGPRPLPTEYLPRYTEFQKRRHLVKAGITGLSQIKGRNNLTWSEKFSYDVHYVEHIGFWMDAEILLKTATYIIRGQDVVPDFNTVPLFESEKGSLP